MAELTALAIAQEFCRRTNLPNPSTLVGAQDDTTLQILGLMNEGAQDIGQRYNLQDLQTLCSFTHANAASYQALDLTSETLVPGYKFMIDQTFWNLTNRLQMGNPQSARDWQFITTMLISGALYRWTTYSNAIFIYPVPVPAASVNFSFFFQSRFGVYSPAAAKFTINYLEDASFPRFDSELVLMDIKWRWKREKGLPYAEDQRTCEGQLVNMVGRESAPTVTLDGENSDYGAFPALYIPVGSWPHP
jgi:hypothetical protein